MRYVSDGVKPDDVTSLDYRLNVLIIKKAAYAAFFI